MPDSQPFVDYYAILQVNPGCDLKIIEGAYRHFAKLYHPDHGETADVERFAQIIDAYNMLKFPAKRARYDELWQVYCGANGAPLPGLNEAVVGEGAALADAALQQGILLYLYRQRRENFSAGGIGDYMLQEHFGCSDENYAFHMWYLRAKGFVEKTEHGTMAITVQGVDHVMTLEKTRMQERYITDQSPSEA